MFTRVTGVAETLVNILITQASSPTFVAHTEEWFLLISRVSGNTLDLRFETVSSGDTHSIVPTGVDCCCTGVKGHLTSLSMESTGTIAMSRNGRGIIATGILVTVNHTESIVETWFVSTRINDQLTSLAGEVWRTGTSEVVTLWLTGATIQTTLFNCTHIKWNVAMSAMEVCSRIEKQFLNTLKSNSVK